MCVPPNRFQTAIEARKENDRQKALLGESSGGVARTISQERGAPREVPKDTRGSQENKDKLKSFQPASDLTGASPGKPKLSAPRERSPNKRGYLNPNTDILQGKDIGF